MALEPLETAEGNEFPGCVQLSVFLENRVGQLLRLMRLFEGSTIKVLGLTVESSVDCAIVRIIVDNPDDAQRMLIDCGFAVSMGEVLVVELPAGKRGIMTVSRALITSEVNVNYIYAMIATDERPACLAIHVDDLAAGATTLIKQNFHVLNQGDLKS